MTDQCPIVGRAGIVVPDSPLGLGDAVLKAIKG